MKQPPYPPKPATTLNAAKSNLWVELHSTQGFQPIGWISSAGYSLALVSVGFFVSSASVSAAEPAQAGLDFSLPASLSSTVPVPLSADGTPARSTTDTTSTTDTSAIAPLAIPSEAIAPPVGKADTNQILPPPPPVADSDAQVAAAASELIQPEALDPPSSPQSPDQGRQTTNVSLSTKPQQSPEPPQAIAAVPELSRASEALDTSVPAADLMSSDGALNFSLHIKSRVSVAPSPPSISLAATHPPLTLSLERPTEPLTETLPAEVQAMFEGDENSQVAIAIGSAEGTRTPDGGKSPAYHGHVDPGNGVWNLGSFSYQHGAKSPEDADQRQLKRLKTQAKQLHQIAQTQELALSPQEFLNGLDLANQSPAAALSRGGYIDRLLEARQMGFQGDEAIAWARTRSFLDPDSQQWNAPGLGNTVEGISSDQERRMHAIAQTFVPSDISSSQNQVKAPYPSNRMPMPPSGTLVSENLTSENLIIDQLLRLDLPPTH